MGETVADVHGVRCPKCSDDEGIQVLCLLWADLYPDGATSDDGEVEWNDESRARCVICQHEGTAAAFQIAADEYEETRGDDDDDDNDDDDDGEDAE